MWDILFYVLVFGLLGAAGVVGAMLMRGYDFEDIKGLLVRGRVGRRLDVVEHSSVDGRRRLVLIRRDDVEHLIMTGGPVDVVIETNIGSAIQQAPAPDNNVVERAVFARQPRKLGQVANG